MSELISYRLLFDVGDRMVLVAASRLILSQNIKVKTDARVTWVTEQRRCDSHVCDTVFVVPGIKGFSKCVIDRKLLQTPPNYPS